MGWSSSFVGTLFIALATSVPELAAMLGALRLGAVDIAVGNLLGSNLFDILILVLDDLAYVQGPLYTWISPMHIVSAFTGGLMSVVVVVALVRRPVSRLARVFSPASLMLLTMYLLNTGFQFLQRY